MQKEAAGAPQRTDNTIWVRLQGMGVLHCDTPVKLDASGRSDAGATTMAAGMAQHIEGPMQSGKGRSQAAELSTPVR